MAADPSLEIERLRQRLERERKARRTAEAIAEKGLLDLYDGQQRLKLLETISSASNRSSAAREAFAYGVSQICGFTGWSVGHVYLPRGRGRRVELAAAGIWHWRDRPAPAFMETSETTRFRPGEGLPGRVYLTREPAWIADIAAEENFPRAAIAREAGLRAAIAFPVLLNAEVKAVMEFFSETLHEPDEDLLQTLAHVGAQLGRVVERAAAERRLKAKNLKLVAAVEEAERQRLAAEAANRAKSAFLAVTSHEVRTPLHAVLGLAEALRREPLTAGQARLVDGVIDAGAMLMRLLNAVLDLSKIESERLRLALDAFDLRRTVEATAQVWTARAEELGVSLALDFAALPQPCRIVSDEGKVEQTLINLLSNALKFTPAGGFVRIRTIARQDGGRWLARIEVADSGPGVPPDDEARIFKPFEQTDLGRTAGGAGLGLSICAGNASALGGAIGLDRLAPGSRFWFEFPADNAAEPAAPAQPPPVPAAPGRRLKVLAAEDHPANRQVLAALLGAANVALVFAENGREAVEAVAAGAFDLVLMDANMPVMNGEEAVTLIRAAGGPTAAAPIYMLTANVFEEDIARYLASGADGVLKKPLDLRELHALLASIEAGTADPRVSSPEVSSPEVSSLALAG